MTHILIINADFYQDISAQLLSGAATALSSAGATHDTITVPGALEIPAAIRFAIKSGKYDGYVALGCVIRGETYHFEIVSQDSARGLTWLAIENKAAIGNGILTVETMDQAMVRADVNHGNKGGDAAVACLRLIELKHQFRVKP